MLVLSPSIPGDIPHEFSICIRYYINLKTKMQCSDDGDETHNVRRKFYHPVSPAGKGAKWEWAGDTDDWHTYDMEVQCLIEEAWARVSIS